MGTAYEIPYRPSYWGRLLSVTHGQNVRKSWVGILGTVSEI